MKQITYVVVGALGAALAAAAPFSTAAQTAAGPTAEWDPRSKPSGARPWGSSTLPADDRAALVLEQMTYAEKLKLVFGYFSTNAPNFPNSVKHFQYPRAGRADSAGFVEGVPRLGVPNQWQTDAGMGVATQQSKTPRLRTALPSGLAVAASWSAGIARDGGAMIGNEAFLSGFNVMLAGAANLVREPRGGRTFEYAGEDPLLSGTIVGNQIKGIQSQNVISTLKHFAFNDQETRRNSIDHRIGEQAARQSDLLAFEIAHEIGRPGSVMCAYNRVNGAHSCENEWLLNRVLKRDLGFKGYVMSDWGAVHSTTQSANAGLDQQSGWAFDASPYFHDALREAVNGGHVTKARLDDMVRRILRSMFAVGLFDRPVTADVSASIDYPAHAAITQAAAEEGIVLLKNAGALPLAKSTHTILIVGGHADVGVLSGGGSSQVYPHGGPTDGMIVPNEGPKSFPGPKVYYPSSPLRALQARTRAKITYIDGKDVEAAAAAAAKADIVIVFAEQWTGEGADVRDLNLPGSQNALIDAVASAAARSVVVLQTGGAVLMPWLQKVDAVVEAWYPGTSGGEAIARVLTGEVNPSGSLPITFPASVEQLPRPTIEGLGVLDPNGHPLSDYDVDGAAVGYKWYDKAGIRPLFHFGHGLSYTRFAMSDVSARPAGGGIAIRSVVRNVGRRRGKVVVQAYVAGEGWEAPRRLGAFVKVDLAPGERRVVNLSVDHRLLATFETETHRWVTRPGRYQVSVTTSTNDLGKPITVPLAL